MQVLERILAVDFRFPGSIPVSAECKNLLSRILVADPAKRASIEEIQQHPWCAPAALAPSGSLGGWSLCHICCTDGGVTSLPSSQLSSWCRHLTTSHQCILFERQCFIECAVLCTPSTGFLYKI